VGIITALNPWIGYENATALAQEALATGKRVYELVLEKKLLDKAQLDAILQPVTLTRAQVMPTRE
jgi:aspartate ammonia-lyase